MGNRCYILNQLLCISTTSKMLLAINTLTEPFNKMHSLKSTFGLQWVDFDPAFLFLF